MKKIYTSLLVTASLFLSSLSSGQNLVPNPSFEEYDMCPDFFDQLSRAHGWWSARPTADYFNACAPYFPKPIVSVNVPSNSFGYRTAASGSAYVGIIAKEANDEYRETIGTELIQKLNIDTKYYISFKISSGGQINPNEWCGINKLGVLFSTVKYDSISPSPICNNCAQIISDLIIIDTLNWTTIKGSFIADSNYSFISIGRFNYNYLTDSIQLTGKSCYAYYFIDDVCISTDSAYTYSYMYISIHESEKESLLEYSPNPVKDFLRIGDHAQAITEISVFNIVGRLIRTYNFTNESSHYINLSFLSAGTYNLVAYRGTLKPISQLIIKL